MAEAPSKLASHIMAGEPHITKIEAQMQAALALADHITDSMHAALKAQHGKATPCAGDGLNAVLDTVNDHVGELRSWWRQLHELAVVQGRRTGMAEDLEIIDKVELCLKGLDGIATIAAHLQSKFSNDLEVAPAARGLSILSSDTIDRLDDVAEELHNTRHGARMPPDPHVEWQARHAQVFNDSVDRSDDEMSEAVDDAVSIIEVQMATTPAKTPAGIAAQLRCVLTGLKCQYGDEGNSPMTRNWIGCLTQAVESLEARQ